MNTVCACMVCSVMHMWGIMCAGLDASMCAHVQMCKNDAWTYVWVRLSQSVCVCVSVYVCTNTWQGVSLCVPETQRQPGPAGSSLLPGSLHIAWAFFRPAAPEPWSWHLEVISLTNRQNNTIRVCAHCPFCVQCGSENIWFRSFDVIFYVFSAAVPFAGSLW